MCRYCFVALILTLPLFHVLSGLTAKIFFQLMTALSDCQVLLNANQDMVLFFPFHSFFLPTLTLILLKLSQCLVRSICFLPTKEKFFKLFQTSLLLVIPLFFCVNERPFHASCACNFYYFLDLLNAPKLSLLIISLRN